MIYPINIPKGIHVLKLPCQFFSSPYPSDDLLRSIVPPNLQLNPVYLALLQLRRRNMRKHRRNAVDSPTLSLHHPPSMMVSSLTSYRRKRNLDQDLNDSKDKTHHAQGNRHRRLNHVILNGGDVHEKLRELWNGTGYASDRDNMGHKYRRVWRNWTIRSYEMGGYWIRALRTCSTNWRRKTLSLGVMEVQAIYILYTSRVAISSRGRAPKFPMRSSS